MAETNFDLIVIGSGPGGYVAAIRAAQLGMRVACVEREFLGGTCLNVGCIPSKALLDSSHKFESLKHGYARQGIKSVPPTLDLPAMIKFKEEVVQKNTSGVGFLFKKNKIEHIKGHGKITAPGKVEVLAADGSPRTVTAKNILIATGSAPIQIPSLLFDGKNIISSTEALALTDLPKKMIVVGGGYIGVEMSSVWARLGTEILVLEFLPQILIASDREMALALQKLLEKQGIKFRFNTTAQGAEIKNGKVRLTWKSGEQTGVEEVDKVLVCVGRRPVTDNLGLKELGVDMDAKGFIKVDPKTFQTNVPGVYAIGDVIGGIMLAHKAEEEGVAAAEIMAGRHGHVNYHACPSVVYTSPQLAQVGYTEDDAKKAGHEIKVGKFPFTANGYARATDETDGFVKIIGDTKTDRLLGVHILSSDAATLIAEATLAMEFAASVEDVARSFHPHPTLEEAIKEAALATDKQAIHM
ncbi:MAG: dihydrolipoamide dehydrogenase [Phycisphaerales bacterium]|jgi:dihydrolipoamide dehydrogenase|nr:dihydrolipoamide dehydrogenase [Phycisphaerales bacterium]